MFDIAWSELLIIGVIALIAIGPKELPGVLRALGHWMGKIRRMASEFQDQFREAMREAEVADIKQQVDDLTSQAQGYTSFDPLDGVRKDFESIGQDKPPAATAEAAAPTTAAAGSAADTAAAPGIGAPETAASETAAPETAAREPKPGSAA